MLGTYLHSTYFLSRVAYLVLRTFRHVEIAAKLLIQPLYALDKRWSRGLVTRSSTWQEITAISIAISDGKLDGDIATGVGTSGGTVQR